jgi:hypothetical protein
MTGEDGEVRAELREQVRDFIYDHTKDGFGHGWTLSAEEAERLIRLVRRAEAQGLNP